MNRLTSERWRRIRTVLDRALETPPEARAALIRELCGGDADLEAEIEALVAADARAGRLFDAPVAEFADALLLEIAHAATEPEPAAGRQVGPYRLIRELARGGMGTVYLAERADGQFEQQVAVKLLRRGLDTDDVLHRFVAERQILASLNHPNIARLVDGGSTDDGRPYLVMEYVAGEPIDTYCDACRLPIDQRLRLFLTVAGAVQHAHRNLVVHRDLKPGNILISATGAVKLLDFGIAKLLQPEGADAASFTRTGVRLLTPEYASPEQLRGEPATTASDVYQLGLLLYELLCGHRPHRLTGRTHAGIEDIGQEIPRPSTAVMQTVDSAQSDPLVQTTAARAARARSTTPQRLRNRLAGDLDAITLHALRSDAAHRYPTVDALAEDIQLHLAGMPVRARGISRTYRAQRFVRRHRGGAIVSAIFLLLLSGYAVTVGAQAGRLERERDRAAAALMHAELEAEKAEQVAGFMIGLFEAGHPGEGWGQHVTGRELLDRGARQIETLGDRPELQARLHEVIGRTYLRLAVFSQARPHLEQALALRQALHSEPHADVAASLHDLGVLLRSTHNLAEAEARLAQAVATRRILADDQSALAASLRELARLLVTRGELEQAEPLFREALAIQRRLDFDGAQIAVVLSDLGKLLWRMGDLQAAEPVLHEAVAWHRQARGERHPFVAGALNDLALIMLDRKDYPAAESVIRQAIAIQASIMGEDSPLLGTALHNLAVAMLGQDDHATADSLARRAVALSRPRGGARNPNVATFLGGLARVQLHRGDPAAAVSTLREAIDVRRGILPDQDWEVADLEGLMGEALAALGRDDDAHRLLLSSYSSLNAKWGPRHRLSRQALERLVSFYESRGRPDEAAPYRAQARQH